MYHQVPGSHCPLGGRGRWTLGQAGQGGRGVDLEWRSAGLWVCLGESTLKPPFLAQVADSAVSPSLRRVVDSGE